jgi:hypothetical protein
LTERENQRQARLDFRTGQICALIANVNKDAKKRPQAYQPGDFFPALNDVSKDEPEPGAIEDPNELLAHIMAWGAAGKSTMRLVEQ